MKNSEKKSSLIISITFAVLESGVICLLYNTRDNETFLKASMMIIPVIMGVLMFCVLKRTFLNFVQKQVKSVSSTLENFYRKDDNLKLKNISGASEDTNNVISHVNEEVAKWAREKVEEISNLKSNEKYRKEYLGNVSHELKTPLFNIQGYIETLMDGGLDDPEINMKYLDRAAKNITRLISIVKELETISKLETGNLKLVFEPFDLVETVREVFEFYDMKAKSKNISLSLSSKTKTAMAEGDKTRIYEVIANLVINSINYGKDEGNTTVEIVDIGKKWLVEVKDDGIGISEENIQRVFERFFRVDKSRSSKNGGTGLGLAIVKHILEAHGESVTVRSKINEGTAFSFTLKKAEK
jgi:two-component system phosphate regulon sensor histidine kinase PhoR